MNPVYSIFGYKMRLNWVEPHHLYWGILEMLISSYGFMSAVVMFSYGYEHQMPAIAILGAFFMLIQSMAFSIGVYVAWDDIDQHHMQVLLYDPLYHSPVHEWFHSVYKYPIVKWATIKMEQFFKLFRSRG